MIYYKNKWGKLKSLICKSEKQYVLQMKFERSKTNFVAKRMTNATLGGFAKKWKGENFCTDEPAKSPIPKTQ